MSIFAPLGNINNELDAPLNDDTKGIIYNIYDITYSDIFPEVWTFEPRNMMNTSVYIPDDPDDGWDAETVTIKTPLGSAYTATYAEYKNFKELQLNTFLNIAVSFP